MRMEKTYQSRCMAENTKIIEEIVSLRQKQSQLLGYENHAAYIQEVGIIILIKHALLQSNE